MSIVILLLLVSGGEETALEEGLPDAVVPTQ